METSDIKRLKELEDENRRLKAMFADLSLEHRIAVTPAIRRELVDYAPRAACSQFTPSMSRCWHQ